MNRHQLRQVAEQQPPARRRALGAGDLGIVLVLLAIASAVGIVGWL